MIKKSSFVRFLVWKSVLELETFSVKEIAERTGKLLSTVSQIIHQMYKKGLIEKVGNTRTKGRPKDIYRICKNANKQKKIFDYINSISLDTDYIYEEHMGDSYYESLKLIEEIKSFLNRKGRKETDLEEKENLKTKINEAKSFLNSAYYENLAFRKDSQTVIKKLKRTYGVMKSLEKNVLKIKVLEKSFSYKAFLTIISRHSLLRKIRINVDLFHDLILLSLGKEKGWFYNENLDPQFVLIPWKNTLAALMENEIDIANFNVEATVEFNMQEKYLEFVILDRIFHPIENNFSIIIRKDSELKTYKEIKSEENLSSSEAKKKAVIQLEGKKIITTKNTDFEKGLKAVLSLANLDLSDVFINDWDSFNGLKLFSDYNEGEAYIGGMLPRIAALEKYKMRELINGNDINDIYPSQVNSIVTKEEYYKSEPQIFEQLKRVIYRTSNFVSANRKEAAEFIYKKLKIFMEHEFQNFITIEIIEKTLGDFKEYVNERETKSLKDINYYLEKIYKKSFRDWLNNSVIAGFEFQTQHT